MTAIPILLAAPLLIAATAPAGQGLDTPTLLAMTTAIVAVVVLRGVLLRRGLRKRRARRSETPVSRKDDGVSGPDAK